MMATKTIYSKDKDKDRIRIYLLACRNLLWDILRLPSSRRAALGLYVILTLWRGRGANQPPYVLLHRSSPRYALRHGIILANQIVNGYEWLKETHKGMY